MQSTLNAKDIFDRKLLTARRARVALEARHHDFLLRRVSEDFAERLSLVNRRFSRAVCIGSYHGIVSAALGTLPAVGPVSDLDSCADLLEQSAANEKICADEERLPFAPQSLDLIVSGLSLQLVNDLPGTLIQIQRALKPDGLFLAALLGGETLKELRESWLAAEDEITGGVSPRVAPFADLRDAGALLQRAGFALPVADSDKLSVTYETPLALMREIKAMGMSNMLILRRRVPVTKTLLARAAEIYAERFSISSGRIAATFEIITLTAWAPHESQQKPLRPGSAALSLKDVLQRTPEPE